MKRRETMKEFNERLFKQKLANLKKKNWITPSVATFLTTGQKA